MNRSERETLPNRRKSYTQKVNIGEQSIYLMTGEFADGRLGEIFIEVNKLGTIEKSMFNAWSKLFSIALQYGVPLEELVDSFLFTKFDPSGVVTGHRYIKMASSMTDFIVRDLAIHYLGREDLKNATDDNPTER